MERLFTVAIIVLLLFTLARHVEGSEEVEVFRTYSLEFSPQPLSEDPSIPTEELYEASYAKYTVPIVVAADEEFQQISYWVPWNINGLNWKEAALNIIERADNYIFSKYGVDFRVVGWATWQSDNATTYDVDRIHELADDLNWNPAIKGKTILAGFTGQAMGYNGISVDGCAFNPTYNSCKVILMRTPGYPFDDNLFHHEISHLFGAPDCYDDDCVMSYKTTFVTFWYEDGWIFTVFCHVPIAYQTHKYCYSCEWQVFHGSYSIQPYINFMYGKTSPGVGKGLHEGYFPM